MNKTVGEIAKAIKGKLKGDASIELRGVAGLKEARSGELSFLANPKYAALLSETKASAVIVADDVVINNTEAALIYVSNSSRAFS